MNPEFIKAEIRIAWGTLAAFAAHINVSPQALGKTISGIKRSRPIEVAIAVAIKKPVHEIFPQWYPPAEAA